MKRCWTKKAISGTKCGAAATHKVTAGCIHEHITTGFACGQHIADLAEGEINCARCYEGDDGHVCALLARVEPIGATT